MGVKLGILSSWPNKQGHSEEKKIILGADD